MAHVLVTYANASSTNVSGIWHLGQHVARNWNQQNVFKLAICTTAVRSLDICRGWG
jgi:hypothetical protein